MFSAVFTGSIFSVKTIPYVYYYREILVFVNKWDINYVKFHSSKVPKYVKPFHRFISGGAIVGKAHLHKTICLSVSKSLMRRSGYIRNPRVWLLSPASVEGVNIDGATIHSGEGRD